VRIIDSTSGTAARTRVLIESTDGISEWGTVGVHDNIIEASLQALVDSLEFALVRFDETDRLPAFAKAPAGPR
jgi:2-isopropylmalate synthase